MTQEQAPCAMNQPLEWVQCLSPADRAEYDQARRENIDEILPAVRILIDNCLPGLKEERPEQFETTAVKWAMSCRNTFEDGMQAGKDAWENPSDPSMNRFMRMIVGNWAG